MLYKRENTVSKTPGIAHESNAVRHLQTLHDITILLPREEKLHESDPAVPSASGVCVSAVSAAGSLKRFDTLLLWVHLRLTLSLLNVIILAHIYDFFQIVFDSGLLLFWIFFQQG